MGLGDTIRNAAEDLGGQTKERIGRAADDATLEAEGRGQQAAAQAKQAGKTDEDALHDVEAAVRGDEAENT